MSVSFRFTCPACRLRLQSGSGGQRCAACGRTFECRDRIHRFLLDSSADDVRRFHQQYATVRMHDGVRSRRPHDYRRLPEVREDDPNAAVWHVRRESYRTLIRRVPIGDVRAGSSVADLGAGNGWLSHRLARQGYGVVAVDRLDDDADGLGACRHYETPFACVQADFNALPFESASVDLVVLNGSLHYSADPQVTLGEARRVLAPCGVLAVMDSPMFDRSVDGEAMVAAQLTAFQRDYGIGDVVRPGIGFLTFEGLRQVTASLGLRGRFFPSRGTWGWRIRRQFSRLRLKRAPAAFGVWVAQ